MVRGQIETIVERLSVRLDEVEQENAQLRAQVAILEDRASGSDQVSTLAKVTEIQSVAASGETYPGRSSRRTMLRTALGAAVATVGAGALAEANRGSAFATPSRDVGKFNNSSPGMGAVYASSSSQDVINPGRGVWGFSAFGIGVEGQTNVGRGVFGYSDGDGATAIVGQSIGGGSTGISGKGDNIGVVGEGRTGVSGTTRVGSDTHAPGVGGYSETQGTDNTGVVTFLPGPGIGVFGNTGTGVGVFGTSSDETSEKKDLATGSGIGVYGTSDRGVGVAADAYRGTALRAHMTGPDHTQTAVVADGGVGTGIYATTTYALSPAVLAKNLSSSGGIAITGTSTAGRGGIFQGPLAAVQLVPASAPIHPRAGQAGDLFVDSTHRLWFCVGGTAWKQLA